MKQMKRKSESMTEPTPTLVLTPDEEKLFAFLLDVDKQKAAGLTLRVAGGWVRDKLLGRSSDDIDIVLDTMTGAAFAELVNTYEVQHGHATHTVGIIKANPEQSKHLETATMQLGSGWIDFVNLRAETYADNEAHRIPSMEFGSPLQDAERRDFTINSLFYNLNTRSVEDYTAQGLKDLADGIVRTPLEPRVTFLDDPLRILRAVRFAARFQFELEASLCAALRLPEVKDALLKKVSRERVGKELSGMLAGTSAHPDRALALLAEFGLLECVFALPTPCLTTALEPATLPPETWPQALACALAMHRLLHARSPANVNTGALDDAGLNRFKIEILAATLLPLAPFVTLQKKKTVAAPYWIIRDGLKLRAKDAEDVANVVHKTVDRFRGVELDRVAVGLLLRDVGDLWGVCADVAFVYDTILAGAPVAATEAKYAALRAFVADVGLDRVWELKPILDGKELMTLLSLPPGPGVRVMSAKVVEYQLAHPAGTRDECLAHLRSL
ncbi:tRNA nucleotidyltransferase [Achlya hypogyna]|uniref:tRNA nucleotidyltransferase n=1 Tax=Achlya hypogyna TaxID=1202772 RepID=A0A1V9YG75_ACHHY|nr:tRNA nucleotidyltransferase [Achlya hypogyna]